MRKQIKTVNNRFDEKVETTLNISQVQLKQVQELLGEFMARVITNKTIKSEQFDIRYVQHNLKLNQ